MWTGVMREQRWIGWVVGRGWGESVGRAEWGAERVAVKWWTAGWI